MQVGTIWVALGLLVIAAGSFMVYHGNTLNQQESEKKILDRQKKSEAAIRNDIEAFKNTISNLQETQGKELSSKFPGGYYQLFGIVNKEIIPSAKPSSEKIKISWSTAKVLNVTRDFVDIMLPDAILPGNTVLNSNIVRVKNEEGVTTANRAFVINGWSPFVEILKSDEKQIIAVVGYSKIK
jgi:hypothetical protein